LIRSSLRACRSASIRPLGVDDDTVRRLQIDAEPVLTIVTLFVTSNYNNLLAAEVTDDADAMD